MKPRSAMPPDQAQGLRRMFARSRLALVPVVANPHIAFPGLLLERICAALDAEGARTLLVDAAESAPPAAELATLALGDGIEALTPSTSYLAARGLPLRHLDAGGSAAPFLQELLAAAPRSEVVLVHAGAGELARLFARQTIAGEVVPLLLADDRPASVTHAYAAMKWLVLRARLGVHRLLLEAAPGSPRAERIAAQIAHCGESFLGARLRDRWIVDPASHGDEPPAESLRRLARALLGAAAPLAAAPARARHPSPLPALN